MSPRNALCWISLLLVICPGCKDNPSGLELPDFVLKSVVFSGDSTGGAAEAGILASVSRVGSRGDPYCEITLSWDPPPETRGVLYSVHRSLLPGIASGSIPYRTVGNTVLLTYSDSDSMSWAKTYYYAISGLLGDSTVLWSNEESITTPAIGFPTPSVLVVEDLLLGKCMLNWSVCPDPDFYSYTVVVLESPGSAEGDTVGVFYNVTDTLLTETASPFNELYYQVTTTDAQNLRSKSNVVEYIHNGELPWKLGVFVYITRPGCYTQSPFTISHCGKYIYYFEMVESPYTTWYITRISTQTGSRYIKACSQTYSICHVSSQNGLLISYNLYGKHIDILDEVSLSPISTLSVDFACSAMVSGLLDSRAILCPDGRDESYVLETNSMTFIDTLDYTFTHGQPLGSLGTFVWGGSRGLCRLDVSTLSVAAECPISVSGIPMISSDGSLLVISDQHVLYKLNPLSLQVIASTQMPANPAHSVVTEAMGEAYVYYPNGYYSADSLLVMNSSDWSLLGKVNLSANVTPGDLVFLPEQDQIWCQFMTDPNRGGYLSIIR